MTFIRNNLGLSILMGQNVRLGCGHTFDFPDDHDGLLCLQDFTNTDLF